MKKIIFSLAFIATASLAMAQNGNSVGPNGPNGSGGSGSTGGQSYSTGYIPSDLEVNQNRPDSTQHGDTTYREQQWNGATAKQDSTHTKKKTTSKTPQKTVVKKTTVKKTTTTTKKNN